MSYLLIGVAECSFIVPDAFSVLENKNKYKLVQHTDFLVFFLLHNVYSLDMNCPFVLNQSNVSWQYWMIVYVFLSLACLWLDSNSLVHGEQLLVGGPRLQTVTLLQSVVYL